MSSFLAYLAFTTSKSSISAARQVVEKALAYGEGAN
jgi:hypothetical protein